MKYFKLLTAVLMVTVISAQGQTAQSSTQGFTDEDLKKYVITMDSVKGMQLTLNEIITDMVQQNTVMSVTRYNELYKIVDNEAKLSEAKATPAEIQFLKDVAEKRKEEFARINATYQGLAKDYVGAKTFNAIKKSIESDQAVKAKYEEMTKEMSNTQSKGG